ncbi:MAG: aminodeoxychorismate/anthranilate synthase component II [Flavobacteriaceae bacterium]|jgi:anthranilate synthase/aminodeoxychorismate synthase-like glutamine amidotransferase|nr:aminodeoxychorismate/anthranilate synthase component II [Flavobacteriaceae bacterium]
MSTNKQIVIIDNYDSFTYNLYQLFDEHPQCSITVIPSNEVILEDIEKYDQIVLSPGPDIPSTYPVLFDILERFKATKPILGVCLGHQTIGEFFGGELINLTQVFHGQQRQLQVIEKEELLFKGITINSPIGLYHSWALKRENLPSSLVLTAVSNDGVVMGICHRKYNIKGIQFHPESYMTKEGKQMIANWIEQE